MNVTDGICQCLMFGNSSAFSKSLLDSRARSIYLSVILELNFFSWTSPPALKFHSIIHDQCLSNKHGVLFWGHR